MLHLLMLRHTAESCPSREINADARRCFAAMRDELTRRGVAIVGRWADPPAHQNFIVLDAPDAHTVQAYLMESGLLQHTTSELRAVVSMD